MVAVVIEDDAGGAVAAARIAVGACSEVARRLPDLEAQLAGQPLSPELGNVPRAEHLDQRHVEAMLRGWGPEDSDAVARLQEEKSGVQLRLTGI